MQAMFEKGVKIMNRIEKIADKLALRTAGDTDQMRFTDFTRELAVLSKKYGVVVKSVGGVSFGQIQQIRYSSDASSGDLTPTVVWGETEEGVRGVMKWGFDSTAFKNVEAFERVLSSVGISPSQEPKRGHIGEFIWRGPGIEIATGNNPITGEYMRSGQRDPEIWYASYIGIEGDSDKVAMAVKKVKQGASYIKGESKGEREFI